ncbi:hypothetical protein HID58_087514 [Brassica napus]|uniref:UBX domain-containing protein n=1 Tax=Brassica napus TaxID=3708 RepID=A0ABQ7XTI7_BRANA|nr:hypothetical protein HID58_087514 [Brassica napus]
MLLTGLLLKPIKHGRDRERKRGSAVEREAARVRMRQEKAPALGDEPEKGPDVTQVLVRFPNGERKGRRFESNIKI